MDSKLLEILVCPRCKGSLLYNRQEQELICQFDKLAWPIIDNIPRMLENKARKLEADD